MKIKEAIHGYPEVPGNVTTSATKRWTRSPTAGLALIIDRWNKQLMRNDQRQGRPVCATYDA
ncbi:hypothetical protein [Caballeronia glathei]|uniref:hypothetical protein n=1 Tax=Caballeronia glathei TaxID=60547 RepID=UPI000A4CF81F|nr:MULTISPECIES: hypothetical protein [Burkholderiaceae]